MINNAKTFIKKIASRLMVNLCRSTTTGKTGHRTSARLKFTSLLIASQGLALIMSPLTYANTSRLNLNVPSFQSSRWDIPLNVNWATIDAAVAGLANFNAFTSSNTFGSTVSFNSSFLLNGSAGNSGQVLTSAGAAFTPTWSTPIGSNGFILNQATLQTGATFYVSSGTVNTMNVSTFSVRGIISTNSAGYIIGTVVQSFQTTYGVQTSTTNNLFTVAGASVTITPLSSTDKIRITLTGDMYVANANASSVCIGIFRGVTNLSGASDGMACAGLSSTIGGMAYPVSVSYLDSPATTSAIVYQGKIRSTDGATSVSFPVLSTSIMLVQEIAQ